MAARAKTKKPAPKKKVATKTTKAKAAPKKKVAAAKAAPKKKVAAPKKLAPKKKVAAANAAPKKKVAAPKKVGEAGALAAAEIAGAVAAETRAPSDRAGEVTTADGGRIRAPEPAPEAAEPFEGMPRVGDPAPDFALASDADEIVSLAGLRGRRIVLYFYPKDNTPGCTREAQEFSSLLPEFEAKNAVVLGVSTDSADSHRKFRHTCDLSVKLLSDPDRKAHEAYGTWREKTNYGRTYMGTQRSTFLIDEEGRIQRVWPKVRVEDHALDVLNGLK